MRITHRRQAALLMWLICASVQAADTFTIATYNVENYLDVDSGTRKAKSVESRAKIRESIKAISPDVLALEEMGGTNALMELRASLKSEGVDFPHWEHVSGWDTNIHVAVLSKFPIVARRPHGNDSYLLQGRRLHVSRGFAEVDIQVSPAYTFTLFVAHLKSKRPIPGSDEAEMRIQEATLLREKIDARLKASPNANIAVVGDLNDTKDSKGVRALIGRGKAKLVDTRPSERNGDTTPARSAAYDPPTISWTYFYGKEDTYSRIDYILLSQGMAREWNREGSYIFRTSNWGLASDHRPVVVEIQSKDR